MDVRRDRAHTGIARSIEAWQEHARADRRAVAFLTREERHDRSPSLGEGTAIRRAMKRSDASLFHATYPYLVVPRGVRTLLTLHDTLLLDRGFPVGAVARGILAVNVRRAAALATVSDFSRRQIADRLRVDAGRIHVVPNGVEVPPEPTAAPDRSDPYLLYVGNTKEHKHVGELIEWSAGELPARGLRLVAVVPREGLEAFGERSGPAVQLRGPVEEAELAALRDGALACVSLARGEGFGLPPLEAGARGVPSLLRDAGAHREVMADGAVYCELDRDSFAAALDDLLGRREILAAAARARAEQFTWAASWARLAAIYDALA